MANARGTDNHEQLWFKDKDIEFLKSQDVTSYRVLYPIVPVYFVDHSNTIIDKFNTQPKISHYPDPVNINVLIKTTDMKAVMDTYNLEEIPEATAVFSVALLDKISNQHEFSLTIEEDVLLSYQGVDWRITQVHKADYIGHHSELHLHYECLLERNTRSNAIDEKLIEVEDTYVSDFEFYTSIDKYGELCLDDVIKSEAYDHQEEIEYNDPQFYLYIAMLSTSLEVSSIMLDDMDIKQFMTKSTVISIYNTREYIMFKSNTALNLIGKIKLTYA